MRYIYRHIRLDKNEPFYVGIGSDTKGYYSRAYRHDNRNPHWHYIVKLTPWEVDIILIDLEWEEAEDKEKEFIKLYGRRDLGLGTLVNLTDGGPGMSNHLASEELKTKRRLINTGRKHTGEHKAKVRAKKLGFKLTAEQLEKCRARWKARGPMSKEQRQKIGKGNKGKRKGKFKFYNTYMNPETGVFHFGLKDVAEAYNLNLQTLQIRINNPKYKFPVILV